MERSRRRGWILPGVLLAGSLGAAAVVLALAATTDSADRLPRSTVVPVALQNVSGLAFDGEKLWVTIDGTGLLHRVDPETGHIEHTVQLPFRDTGGSAWDAGTLLQLAYAERLVYRLEPESGRTIETFPSPGAGMCSGMTFDGSSLWLANWEEERLYRIDPAAGGKVLEWHDSALETTGLAWDGAHLWNGVLVGTESHDEATPYLGFVQERDVEAGRTLRVLSVHGVFAGTSNWLPGRARGDRMWWFDGYHDQLVAFDWKERTTLALRGSAVVACLLSIATMVAAVPRFR